MKKPADDLLWLYEQDRSKVEVRYRMTGADKPAEDERRRDSKRSGAASGKSA